VAEDGYLRSTENDCAKDPVLCVGESDEAEIVDDIVDGTAVHEASQAIDIIMIV